MPGLVPGIPIRNSAVAPRAREHCASPIGITGTRPVMTREGHDHGRAHARPLSLQEQCSHFVLDSSSKLGYIVCQFFSPRGALARRRKKREQNTVSGRGSHPLPREAQAARRACPQPQARLTREAPPELTIGGFAAPARLKEPCARALPALHHQQASSRTASRATPRSPFRLVPQGPGPKVLAL